MHSRLSGTGYLEGSHGGFFLCPLSATFCFGRNLDISPPPVPFWHLKTLYMAGDEIISLIKGQNYEGNNYG